jgi:HAD superfamily hydrolase (TIGR01509 family)
MGAVRALVLDFDGLVLDTETPLLRAWQRTFADHGTELDVAWWATLIGTADHEDPADRLEAIIGRPTDREGLQLARLGLRDQLLEAEDALPGVVELLAQAEALGLALAVASSSSPTWVGGHLERLGLRSRFGHLACHDGRCRPKPAPDLYLAACEGLGVEPGAAVAFEDSRNGVLAAKSAGLRCVAVPSALTSDMDLSAADLRVPSLADLDLEDLIAQLG